MVLEQLKGSDKIADTIEDATYWLLRGAFVIGAFLFLEKLLGLGFDLSVHLGL